MNLKLSKKFNQLFKQLKTGLQNRFYVYYGGRGSGKSWAIGIFIVLMMRLKKYRVLCTREFQKNIADSSKKLIEDTIKRFKLDHEFDMQRGVTRHKKTGSEILYYGLHHNAQEIKSLEGVDIVWCEESENTSQESLDLLIPTIRKPNSIIIFTLNPDKRENPVYQDFIVSEGYDSLIREKVNYYDNVHFPQVLQEEMERTRERDPEKYDWVWEGNCREFSEAQILKGCYTIKDFTLPNDTPYCFGADWGFSQDPNTLTRMFVDMDNKKLYIDYAIDKIGVEISNTPAFYDQIPRAREFSITADNARPELISHMKNNGFRIKAAQKGPKSIEDGIEFIKDFDVIIHPRCTGVIEEFKLYSYKVDKTTGQVLPDILDKYNHYIDGIRYGLEDYRPNKTKRRKIIRKDRT
ncbi:MAG: PBSX family phage terminase large subunit [Candidatus Brocadiaceae bacterium]|nr:PBSX family phage terminase large subunit [Candidatus Brocadiaceae bacterium]